MFNAHNLIFLPILFSLGLLIYGYVLTRRATVEGADKVLRYVYMVIAAVCMFGVVLFPMSNLGRNEALHLFDFTGLNIALWGTLALGLVGGALFLIRKKFLPGGMLLSLAVVQGIILFLLKFFYTRTTGIN